MTETPNENRLRCATELAESNYWKLRHSRYFRCVKTEDEKECPPFSLAEARTGYNEITRSTYLVCPHCMSMQVQRVEG